MLIVKFNSSNLTGGAFFGESMSFTNLDELNPAFLDVLLSIGLLE